MEPIVPPQPISIANILAATDFSSASQTAVLYAASLARRYGATLHLAHIVRPDTLHRPDSDALRSLVEEAWREGQHLTTDLLISGQLRGIPHKLHVEVGEIWPGLAPLVPRHEIDMIVVGTRGRTGLAKMLLGSTAELVFRQAPCPVLTVGPHSPGLVTTERGLRRILYATDFTPQSLHAAGYALSLAQHYQAHLILLHVIQDSGDPSLQKGRALEEAKMRLAQLLPPATQLQFDPELVVGFGTPGTRILDVAGDKTPELIVLGVTHPADVAFTGRRWSTASEVAAKATCPVLTVRGG